MSTDILYMRRCLQLALLGEGRVAPNPMVGAVLVCNHRIIGEGYHQRYGEAHAEVNCLASVAEADRHLVDSSTLYVSLEPCAHFGKTPPCADLIIQEKIPHVVVGCRDPFPEVDGKGIEKLRNAGVRVDISEIEEECRALNKRFFVFHTQHRPFIILKWAQTANGFIGNHSAERLRITNDFTNRLTHQWRSEETAILVGTRTALADNPSLTTRLWAGRNPLRIIIDMERSLPQHLHIFDGSIPTLVFNRHRNTIEDIKKPAFDQMAVQYYQVTPEVSIVQQITNALYYLNIQSVLVEGGAKTLQSFIDAGAWDEARVITNTLLTISDGVVAPVLKNCLFVNERNSFGDEIRIWNRI